MFRPVTRLAVKQSRFYSLKPQSPAKFHPDAVSENILTLIKSNQIKKAQDEFLAVRRPGHLKTEVYANLFRKSRDSKDSGLMPPKDLFNKFLDQNITLGWACSELILEDVINDQAVKGLETWVRFLESIGDTSKAAATVNREAAWSALVAYITNCIQEGVALDSKVALRLVPLNQVPTEADILSLRNIRRVPKQKLKTVLEGIKKIRHDALDFNSVSFLKSLHDNSPQLLGSKYDEAVAKSKETGVPFTEETYAEFIRKFAQVNQVNKSYQIWNEMQKQLSPTIVGYNALLLAAAQAREQAALQVDMILEQFVDAQIVPNADTYQTIMEFYFRNHEGQKAIDLYNRIENNEIEGISITLRMFNIMLNGLLKMDKVKEAEELFQQGITEKGYSINVVTFNTFLRSYIDRKEFDKIEPLLAEMRKQNIEPSVATYTNVIDATFKAARNTNTDVESSVEALLTEMGKNGLKANSVTMTSIMGGLIKTSRDINSARLFFNTLIKKRLTPNARTFSTIIDGEMTIGDPDQALHYFSLMSKFNLPKSTPIYNQLIKGFADKNRFNDAFNIFKSLVKEKRTDANKYSYYFILQACENNANWERAQEVVDIMANHGYQFDLGTKLPHNLRRLKEHGINVPDELMKRAKL